MRVKFRERSVGTVRVKSRYLGDIQILSHGHKNLDYRSLQSHHRPCRYFGSDGERQWGDFAEVGQPDTERSAAVGPQRQEGNVTVGTYMSLGSYLMLRF